MYPGVTDPHVVGAARLERSIAMRITASRSVKRHPQRPFLALPGPDLGRAQLADAVAARRSHRTFRASPLTLADLATLLHAGYGITGSVRGTPQALRSAPSGGALYPLELYAACHRVDGLDLALYHYDPLRHGLELVRPLAAPVGGELTPYGEALAESAAVVRGDGGVLAVEVQVRRACLPIHVDRGRSRRAEPASRSSGAPSRRRAGRRLLRPRGRRRARRRRNLRGVSLPRARGARSGMRRATARRLAAWLAVGAAAALVAPAVRPLDPTLHPGGEAVALGCLLGAASFVVLARRRISASAFSTLPRQRLLARGLVLTAKSAEEEAIWRALVLGSLVRPLGAPAALAVSTVAVRRRPRGTPRAPRLRAPRDRDPVRPGVSRHGTAAGRDRRPRHVQRARRRRARDRSRHVTFGHWPTQRPGS